MNLQKKWNVYLIHHSHTDIGYTQRQEKIIRYHCDFIRQVIDILDEIEKEKKEEYKGFVWQCENYWQVENFYRTADNTYRQKFEQYVKEGKIGLSGNYLNMTELVSEPVLNRAFDRMESYGKSIAHPITAGMCADINGMAWGYADVLYHHGVKHFFSCVHSHHGMFPLFKKVIPFYWESPEGNRILVWNGDNYHLGNEMFLAPHGASTYMVKDEFSARILGHDILNRNREDTDRTEMEIAPVRIERYLKNLEEEGYVYDFVPFMVSGAITDNAPPGKEIARRVWELNQYYEGKIHFQMVTLEQFFETVEEKKESIPVYRGDWTDWWADGVGSTPAEVKMYKDAVRKYHICQKLDPYGSLDRQGMLDRAMEEMMMYAEHTWGYSSSVSEPWESMVSALELKKGAYAVNANTCISEYLDTLLEKMGEVSIQQDKPQVYKICNPHNIDLYTKVYLYIEFWEYVDGVRFYENIPIEVVDCESGIVIPSQVKQVTRGNQVEILIDVKAKSERTVKIRLASRAYQTTRNHAYIGADGVCDLLERKEYRADEEQIETEDFLICIKDGVGISSILDKRDGTELMRPDAADGAFGGVYEVTPMRESACETRKKMGRNRKSNATKRCRSILKNRRVVENGDIYIAIALEYSLEGTQMYTVFVKVYKHQPRLEATVRIHKDSQWEPENLYVALPFTVGKKQEVFVDKTGCIIRPGMDQLPGTCQDFYLVQNGAVWQAEKKSLAVIARDTPLLTFGDLVARPIVLCDGEDRQRNQMPMYSWVMNNYWETNFKVNLGGFYEFSYTLLLEHGRTAKEMFARCEAENEGLLAFATK